MRAAIAAIYAHYVEQTVATFEEVRARRRRDGRGASPRSCPPSRGSSPSAAARMLGYAYGRPYHARAAYRWTCETGIYLAADQRQHGARHGRSTRRCSTI